MADVELGELLTRTQPHDLGVGRAFNQASTSVTYGKAVDSGGSVIDRCVHVNLNVGILSCVAGDYGYPVDWCIVIFLLVDIGFIITATTTHFQKRPDSEMLTMYHVRH